MPVHLNIAAIAKRTGIAADTLRKWEARYGVLQPTRSPGGHRRYSDLDVARVEWLRARLAEGYRISEAAAMLGTGSDDAPATPDSLGEALYAAIARDDMSALRRLLDQAFGVQELQVALTEVVAPLLERVGAGWASGELTVAQEHAATVEVRARLERLLASPDHAVRGTAVLACAPGERHELGLLMVAVLLRADGWRVIFLGADTPIPAAVAMAGILGARVLCISAAMPERVSVVREELGATEIPRGLAIVVGGQAFDPGVAEALGGRYVNTDLRHAVSTLRKLAR